MAKKKEKKISSYLVDVMKNSDFRHRTQRKKEPLLNRNTHKTRLGTGQLVKM